MRPRAVVTDIEGTVTDITFVKNSLFPFARAALPDFVKQHASAPEIAEQLAEVAAAAGCAVSDIETITNQLITWMDGDIKATPLKTLQGQIWRSGYVDGRIKGHLYPEVADILRHWRQKGIDLYVYSSGSIEAQKLLFAYSMEGDLTPLFNGYFDTRTGHKRERGSYDAIAKAIRVPAEEILFLSDIGEELLAASESGWQTAQVMRPGNTGDARFKQYSDLAEIANDTRIWL